MAPSPQYDPDPAQGTVMARPKGFLAARVRDRELQVAYRTPDGWADSWRKPISPRR
jgi:hypothetical protein